MKVRDFIEWLKTQDQDAVIEVVEHRSGRGYYDQGGTARVVDFDPAKHSEYTDLRGNPYIKPDRDAYNRRSLQLGLHDA